MSGNGVPDAILGAGPGGAPHIRVIDSADNSVVASFYAFSPTIRDGVGLGADDVNGDGRADLIVSSRNQVKVIDGFKLNQVDASGIIADSALLANFTAFGSGLTTPVSLAAGDLNGDNKAEIIVGAGLGGAPHVKVIDGTKLVTSGAAIPDGALLGNFYAYDPSFRGGVFVSVGFNGFARDVIVGSGPGGGPHVRVVDATKLGTAGADGQLPIASLRANFFAYDPTQRGGVRVAADDLNRDGQADVILSSGPGTAPGTTR